MKHATPYHWKSGLPETTCGRGATRQEATGYRFFLEGVLKDLKITGWADVGCGDQNWIPKTHGYQGFDQKPLNGNVTRFDCINEVLPRAFDMIHCRYVINHIVSPRHQKEALKNFALSGSRYLMMTFHSEQVHPKQAPKWVTPIDVTIRHVWYVGVWDYGNA